MSCQKLDYLPGQQALILNRCHKLRFRDRKKKVNKKIRKKNQSQQTYTENTEDHLNQNN